MTHGLQLVSSTSQAPCDVLRPCDRPGYSHDWTLREGQCVDAQTQAHGSTGLREAAVSDRGFAAPMKQEAVSDGLTNNSRRGLPKSTLVFAQHDSATREITISGNQVLLALAAAFCLAGPLLWAFVRYWLFAP
jgi:hypothetical protein